MTLEEMALAAVEGAPGLVRDYAEASIASNAMHLAALAILLALAAALAASMSRRYAAEEKRLADNPMPFDTRENRWTWPFIISFGLAALVGLALAVYAVQAVPQIVCWAAWPDARMLNEVLAAVGR